ncbi:MAG TPA: serine/threonine-protein kinase [Pirellulales bacterium]|nr:serine/threonine-protein kinase [Pirellulales bacterium]
MPPEQRWSQADGDGDFCFSLMPLDAERFPACQALGLKFLSLLQRKTAPKDFCDLVDLFIDYRNKVVKHPVLSEAGYDEVGQLIVLALAEILSTENEILCGRDGHVVAPTAFAGRQLVYVERTEQRGRSTMWRVEHLILHGLVPVRLQPLEVEDPPRAQCVYAIDRAALNSEVNGRLAMYSPAYCVCLHPLLTYKPETTECPLAEWTAPGGPIQNMPLRGGLVPDRAAASATEATPHRGFEIVGQVGAGRHTKVYRVWQLGARRQAAVKQLRLDAPEYAEVRFNREIRLLGRISHANVIPILTCGHDPLWFAMPFVEGPTLADALVALRGFASLKRSGADFLRALHMAASKAQTRAEMLSREAELPPRVDDHAASSSSSMDDVELAAREPYFALVARLVGQLAAGVDALRRARIVHGNIQPENVLVSVADWRPVLIDLGQACDLSVPAKPGELPDRAEIAARFPYVSPEQLRRSYEPDGAIDVYNLGVLLWELLTLRPILDPDSTVTPREAMLPLEFAVPKSVRVFDPTVPRLLERVTSDCMAKDPKKRPSAAELSRVLGNYEGVVPRPSRINFGAGLSRLLGRPRRV